ncbi:hypothetical protein INT47_006263 [Mucor saturninus]|uniref:Mso1 N-terminal domain-containing protein n=1 Tax=Mucor saturninus TaxID=64648 RepID=A0A8H7UXA6_9FUNG|nr:hypothetical protein INT47_006263 [Mucor saturninus]
MGVRNDYRVSTIIVLCKDCNQDVGLYPARHQCNVKRPYLPTLCSRTDDVPELIPSSTVTRQASDSSLESGKWSFFRSSPAAATENVKNEGYFDTSACDIGVSSGKKMWSKVKENEKWKELVDKKEETNRPNKLWSRIIQATMSTEDECGPESDEDDWEGETHVSRILRDYYESKNKPLPHWLFDGSIKETNRGRLWQPDVRLSAREKELQELKSTTISRTQSERTRPFDDVVYGSIAPRRTNTTRAPAKSYRQNIPYI